MHNDSNETCFFSLKSSRIVSASLRRHWSSQEDLYTIFFLLVIDYSLFLSFRYLIPHLAERTVQTETLLFGWSIRDFLNIEQVHETNAKVRERSFINSWWSEILRRCTSQHKRYSLYVVFSTKSILALILFVHDVYICLSISPAAINSW